MCATIGPASSIANLRAVLAFDSDAAGATKQPGGRLMFSLGLNLTIVMADEFAGHKDVSEFWAARHALPPTLAALLPPAEGEVDADGLSTGPLDDDIIISMATKYDAATALEMMDNAGDYRTWSDWKAILGMIEGAERQSA